MKQEISDWAQNRCSTCTSHWLLRQRMAVYSSPGAQIPTVQGKGINKGALP